MIRRWIQGKIEYYSWRWTNRQTFRKLNIMGRQLHRIADSPSKDMTASELMIATSRYRRRIAEGQERWRVGDMDDSGARPWGSRSW